VTTTRTTEDRIRAAVAASRQRQQLPEHVADPAVLEQLAAAVIAARVEEADAEEP